MPKQKNAVTKMSQSEKVKKMSSKAKGVTKSNKKTAPASGGMKSDGDGGRKKFRFRPGTVAIREIKRYQKSTSLILPYAPFVRVCKSITNDLDHDLRF